MISEPGRGRGPAVPGHWEGDLILGLGSSAIGTLVERSSRFTMLLHLPPMSGQGPRVHNGPALAGHGAEVVRDAISSAIVTSPQQLRRSLTWDQGAEMARHAQLRVQAGLPVYFCDPQSPLQRGRTRTPTGCCANTSPAAPISPASGRITSDNRLGQTSPRRPVASGRPAPVPEASGTCLDRHDANKAASSSACQPSLCGYQVIG